MCCYIVFSDNQIPLSPERIFLWSFSKWLWQLCRRHKLKILYKLFYKNNITESKRKFYFQNSEISLYGDTCHHETKFCGTSKMKEFEIRQRWLTVYWFYWFVLLKILRFPFPLTAISNPGHFHFWLMLILWLR